MAILEKKKSKVSDEVPSASMADIAFPASDLLPGDHDVPKGQGTRDRPSRGGRGGPESVQRNILHIIIQPNGLVEVKRGESQQVQVDTSPATMEGYLATRGEWTIRISSPR